MSEKLNENLSNFVWTISDPDGLSDGYIEDEEEDEPDYNTEINNFDHSQNFLVLIMHMLKLKMNLLFLNLKKNLLGIHL